MLLKFFSVLAAFVAVMRDILYTHAFEGRPTMKYFGFFDEVLFWNEECVHDMHLPVFCAVFADACYTNPLSHDVLSEKHFVEKLVREKCMIFLILCYLEF
jgi:hypothetical protein